MSTRALACWSAAALVISLSTTNPVYRALVVLAAFNLLAGRSPAGRSLRPLAWGLLVAGLFAILFNLLFGHVGRDVVARLPDRLPGIGGPLTVESAVFGVGTALGIAGAVLALAPLSLLRDPAEVVSALPRWLVGTGTALAAALNLVPALARSFTAVSDAQRMRGWRPRGPASWSALLIPVVLTALEDSVQLAEAMEARAYGAGTRTRRAADRWRPRDAILAVGALAAALPFLGARLLGALPDWYPYPSIQPPSVSPVLVLACLLLALPALTWRSQSSSA